MKKYLVLKNGEKKEIHGESGKYYFCGDSQFRKSNKEIVDIEIVTEKFSPKSEESEKEEEEAPRKKKNSKKKEEKGE